MPVYQTDLGGTRHRFDDLRHVLACASPLRSGDVLAGIAAGSAEQRIAARHVLADLPLIAIAQDLVVPYEADEVTRLIVDARDAAALAPVAHLTIGAFREWLLDPGTDDAAIAAIGPGLMPEMVAAVSKLMRNQDLVTVARKCRVITAFRSTIGLPGRLSTRLQPNHPTDDPAGIAASILDGLLLGSGDAVIGINPAGDGIGSAATLLALIDEIREGLAIPTQSCVLTHITNTIRLIERGAPVDLAFQSIAGSEAANRGFGIDLALLAEAHDATRALARGTIGDHVMYFETGQGSALSADAHHGVDQQTMECRAYAVARAFRPLLVNSVVGFIGPEYLYDGRQILRAALEDHCCGKLMGLPMGLDICYTNHAEADQDDMDTILTVLGVAGVSFVMGVPGADDIMLNYQSTSFHDALYVREVLGLRPAPEFDAWLATMGLMDDAGRIGATERTILPAGAIPALAALDG
jgi:ethanolamine ammonia-lyase large subunit